MPSGTFASVYVAVSEPLAMIRVAISAYGPLEALQLLGCGQRDDRWSEFPRPSRFVDGSVMVSLAFQRPPPWLRAVQVMLGASRPRSRVMLNVELRAGSVSYLIPTLSPRESVCSNWANVIAAPRYWKVSLAS